jgi:hypothetical protein
LLTNIDANDSTAERARNQCMLIDKAIVSYADEQTLPEQEQPFLRSAVYAYVGCYGEPKYEPAQSLFCNDHYAERAMRNLEEHTYRLHRFCSVNKAFLLTLAGANLAVAKLQTRLADTYSANHLASTNSQGFCKHLYNDPPCSLSQLLSCFRNLHPLSSQGPPAVCLPAGIENEDPSLRSKLYRCALQEKCWGLGFSEHSELPIAKRLKPNEQLQHESGQTSPEQLLTCENAHDETRLAYTDANMVYLQTLCEGMYTSARLMVGCMHTPLILRCDNGPKCLIKLQHHLSLIQTALAELGAHLAACSDGDTDPLICCVNSPDITAADITRLIIDQKVSDDA